MELRGYSRQDGRMGFRNQVLVVPLTGCQMEIARRIAAAVPGATCFSHPHGCDFQGDDADLLGTFLQRFATHPNVGGVLFLAMGCAATLSLGLPAQVKASGRLAHVLNTQQAGTTATVEKGMCLVGEMVAELRQQTRVAATVADLVIGTKCGASDKNSFAYCHPVVGRACDLLVAQGATVVLGEDCELVGGAEKLAARAASPEVAERIRRLATDTNAGWQARFGYTLEQAVLDSGMTRDAWEVASLNSAAKAGTAPIQAVCEMTDIIRGPGLVVLNAPNTDLESMTAFAAAGCTMTLFTTGRGTPVGSPVSITLKITATRQTAERMVENIDIDVSDVIDKGEMIETAAGRVVEAMLAAANGQSSKAELLGHWETAIPIRGVTY